jgi:hypothetical protein
MGKIVLLCFVPLQEETGESGWGHRWSSGERERPSHHRTLKSRENQSDGLHTGNGINLYPNPKRKLGSLNTCPCRKIPLEVSFIERIEPSVFSHVQQVYDDLQEVIQGRTSLLKDKADVLQHQFRLFLNYP